MSSRTLVDANVLLDLVTPESEWASWSASTLSRARQEGGIAMNPVVYAEISVRYPTQQECDASFPESQIERLPVPWEAAFLAGKAFVEYRRAGGSRTSPLPDFFIGAHAKVERLRLLTRDPTRYRTYFPDVELIAP